MKKHVLTGILLGVALLVFAACGSTDNAPEPTTAPPTEGFNMHIDALQRAMNAAAAPESERTYDSDGNLVTTYMDEVPEAERLQVVQAEGEAGLDLLAMLAPGYAPPVAPITTMESRQPNAFNRWWQNFRRGLSLGN